MTPLRPALADYVSGRFPGSRVMRLAGDASGRTFLRVEPQAERNVVIMDYGQPFSVETDDVRLARIFLRAGLPVARVLEVVPDVGCLVLEDLGEVRLESALGDELASGASSPPAALVRAVDLAADVATLGTPELARSDRAAGPALDGERFRFEMEFFLEHYARGLHGQRLTDQLARELHALAERAATCPRPILCHRDFHTRNLMVRPDGSLFMVDIQDARWGPDSYDLASLLRDAYAHIDDAWLEPLIARYLDRVGLAWPTEGFRSRFHRVAAQRMIKALGSFGYLSRARDPRYLEAIPPTVARLRRWLPAQSETVPLFERLEDVDLLNPRPLAPRTLDRE